MSPISPKDSLTLTLTPWQQIQAAMLSYYSSLEYLVALHRLVTDLVNGTVDPLLHQARLQDRDSVLTDARWGSRNTSQNWSNYAWPFLKDLQTSLSRNITDRASGIYRMTAVNEYLRGVEQFSLEWMTPEEEQVFTIAIQAINDWASPLDHTLADYISSDWDDFSFAYYYPAFASHINDIPRFVINTNVMVTTGDVPERTGIYVTKDDPNASLQFAWSGQKGRKLRDANTFNDLGIAALTVVGRKDLWFDEGKMFDFATSSRFANELRKEVIWADGPHPGLAPSAVARKAFTRRKCDWYLVEAIEGQAGRLVDLDTIPSVEHRPRVAGGEPCVESGFYFSPSQPNSRRHLTKGEIAPIFESQYGETIWQWDQNQN